MKGLRLIIAFARDRTRAVGGSIATIRAWLVPLEDRIRLTVADALRKAACKLALGVVAAAFAFAGAGYVLIGLWSGVSSLRRLGAFFLSFTVVPRELLNLMSGKPISTDKPR
jgi:hypothetical protein